MKVLILGGSGLVGSHLKTELEKDHEVTATSRAGNNGLLKFDITNNATFSVFNSSYDAVIDCIVDYTLNLNDKLNNDVIGKERMLRLLFQKKIYYLAISSVSATEANKHLSDYNFSKFLSDETIRHFANFYGLECCILRYSQIFDYNEISRKVQSALYYFIDSLRSNKPLNVFGNPDLKRSYMPIEVLVKTVRKALMERITGTHDIIMRDTYSSNDLIKALAPIVNYDENNLHYDADKKVSEYKIPLSSNVFDGLLQNENCLPYLKKLLLKNHEA